MSKKQKRDMREVWKAMFPKNAEKFLDIGCGEGSMSQHLVKEGKEVVGIEMAEDRAAGAKDSLTNVIVGDAQALELDYPAGYFDCILYGGIINAFNDTLSVLKKHSHYLRDDGYIVLNMPNIRYYKVIHMLLFKGVWDVMDRGILCSYYLRHFTLTNIQELLQDAGYEVEELERNVRGPSIMRFFNRILLNALQPFLTYEYYIRAKKVKTPAKLKPREKVEF